MNINTSARRLFMPAAIFNFLAGGAFVFLLPLLAGPMKIEITPSALPFIHMTAGAVLLLGWGYWQVAVDPARNRIVIVMGIIGKIAIISIALGHALAGNLGYAFMALMVVDLIFTILFWRFLRAYPDGSGSR